MDKIKKAAKASKNFVQDHKMGLAITATAVVGVMINRSNMKTYTDFLEENDLTEKFQEFCWK